MKLSEIAAERKHWTEYRAGLQRDADKLHASQAKISGRHGKILQWNELQSQRAAVDLKIENCARELERLKMAESTELARIAELERSLAALKRGLEPGAISESEARLENPSFVLADHLAELRGKIARLEQNIKEARTA